MRVLALFNSSINFNGKTRAQIQAENSIMASAMKDAASKNKKMSADEVRNIVGISKSAFDSRISNYPDLDACWLAVREKAHVSYTPDEIIKQFNDIYEILLDTKNKNEKITIAQIALMTGLTPSVVKNRIDSSPKSRKVFDEVKHLSKPREYTESEVIKQEIKIREMLKDAVMRGKIVPITYIAHTVGITAGTVMRRIEGNEVLSVYYSAMLQNGVSARKPKEVHHSSATIEKSLLDIFENSVQKPLLNELMRQSGYSKKEIQKALVDNKRLSNYWFEKSSRQTDAREEQTQYDKLLIIRAVNELKRSNETISYRNIEHQTGISYNSIKKYIDNDSELYKFIVSSR